MNSAADSHPVIHWDEGGKALSAYWQSEAGVNPPKRVMVVDDTITADAAYRLACEGTALLWRGDYQNARQLLQALARRCESPARRANSRSLANSKTQTSVKKGNSPASDPSASKPNSTSNTPSPAQAFHQHRLAQSQRARTLGMLLIPVNADYTIPLRRAPDVALACSEAYTDIHQQAKNGFVVSLRELLGLIGGHEWRKNGVEIAALNGRIHPYYGVFSPVRGEYIQLVAQAPLDSTALGAEAQAFDIGTGTGVLAAVLAKRGIRRIVATDQDTRALACAKDNMARLGLVGQVEVIAADLFPPVSYGRAALIVCNPPWLPARPSSPIEYAIYDPESRMLLGFIRGLAERLAAEGEGWLILSDFAEHLGLRTRAELLDAIAAAGLKVVGKLDMKPHHPKSTDASDPLHKARAQELTLLWRLGLQ